MNKPYTVLLSALLLAACAVPLYPADTPPLAEGEVRRFVLERLDETGETVQTALLTVQAQADGQTRWIQTDVFGVPQARLLAKRQGWKRDGFVRPNREAQKLFTQMLPHLKNGFKQPETIDSWRISPLEQP